MNPIPVATPGPTAEETLFGSIAAKMLLKDSTSEDVAILQLDVDKYPALLESIDNDLRRIEIFCNRPVGWARKLTAVSQNLVLKEGNRLNADFFLDWAASRIQMMERTNSPRVNQVLAGAVEKILREKLPPGPLPTTSPTSPSPAA